MNIRWVLVVLLMPFPCVWAAEADKVTLTDFSDHTTGFRYLWQVPRSTLTRLPAWSPTEAEAPLSPHKAAKAATAEIRRYFPDSVQLRAYSISLQEQKLNNGVEVWAYHVTFEAKPQPKGKQKSLLEVLVLLDGTVVSPVVSSLK